MAAVTTPVFDYIHGPKEASLCNKALDRIGAERISDTEENTKQANVCRAAYADTRDELLRLYPASFAYRDELILADTSYDGSGGYAFAFKAEDRRVVHATAGVLGATQVAGVPAADFFSKLVGREIVGTGFRVGTRIVDYDEVAGTIDFDRPLEGASGTSFEVLIPAVRVVEIAHDHDELYELIGAGSEKRILSNVVSGIDDVYGSFLEVRFISRVLDPDRFDENFYDALVLRLASKIAISLAREKGLVSQVQGEFASVLSSAKKAASAERVVDEGDEFWTDRRIGSGPSTRRK